MKLYLLCTVCHDDLELASRKGSCDSWKTTVRVQVLDSWFKKHWHGVPTGKQFEIADEAEIQPAARMRPER
jgi:hypothetical protein